MTHYILLILLLLLLPLKGMKREIYTSLEMASCKQNNQNNNPLVSISIEDELIPISFKHALKLGLYKNLVADNQIRTGKVWEIEAVQAIGISSEDLREVVKLVQIPKNSSKFYTSAASKDPQALASLINATAYLSCNKVMVGLGQGLLQEGLEAGKEESTFQLWHNYKQKLNAVSGLLTDPLKKYFISPIKKSSRRAFLQEERRNNINNYTSSKNPALQFINHKTHCWPSSDDSKIACVSRSSENPISIIIKNIDSDDTIKEIKLPKEVNDVKTITWSPNGEFLSAGVIDTDSNVSLRSSYYLLVYKMNDDNPIVKLYGIHPTFNNTSTQIAFKPNRNYALGFYTQALTKDKIESKPIHHLPTQLIANTLEYDPNNSESILYTTLPIDSTDPMDCVIEQLGIYNTQSAASKIIKEQKRGPHHNANEPYSPRFFAALWDKWSRIVYVLPYKNIVGIYNTTLNKHTILPSLTNCFTLRYPEEDKFNPYCNKFVSASHGKLYSYRKGFIVGRRFQKAFDTIQPSDPQVLSFFEWDEDHEAHFTGDVHIPIKDSKLDHITARAQDNKLIIECISYSSYSGTIIINNTPIDYQKNDFDLPRIFLTALLKPISPDSSGRRINFELF